MFHAGKIRKEGCCDMNRVGVFKELASCSPDVRESSTTFTPCSYASDGYSCAAKSLTITEQNAA